MAKKQVKKKVLEVKPPLSFFPKIYRFITESWKLIVVSLLCGALIFGIILQSLSLYSNLLEERKINQERGAVEKELAFWKKSLSKYKDHRDIYFKIATLEYRLGNKGEAKLNLEKALELDPNFEKGREMEKILKS